MQKYYPIAALLTSSKIESSCGHHHYQQQQHKIHFNMKSKQTYNFCKLVFTLHCTLCMYRRESFSKNRLQPKRRERESRTNRYDSVPSSSRRHHTTTTLTCQKRRMERNSFRGGGVPRSANNAGDDYGDDVKYTRM